MLRRVRQIVIVLLCAALVGSACVAVANASQSDDVDRPVLLVRGFDVFGDGQDCAQAWAVVKAELQRIGRTDVRSVGYYVNDNNCDISLGSYDQHASFGEIGKALNATLAEIGPVDIVGYSAGGLVVSDAVAKGAAGVDGYVPLNVVNLVTAGSPLNGSSLAHLCSSQQCDELRPGSKYLTDPTNGLQKFLGLYDTKVFRADRTQLASLLDGVVSASSATWGNAEHRVTYGAVRHNGFTDDGGDSFRVSIMEDNGDSWRERSTYEPARLIAYALSDRAW